MAIKYIWWQTVEEVMRFPERIIAQVMNIGLFEDWNELDKLFSEHELLYVLQNAECGWFNSRSWHFWHNTLSFNLEIPPLPSRFQG
jgi:hypothetical protein